jgi:hypothetical protein
MFICCTVECVAYQIRSSWRAFSQYKEELPYQLRPQLQVQAFCEADFRQKKLQSSKCINFESRWYRKENLHICHLHVILCRLTKFCWNIRWVYYLLCWFDMEWPLRLCLIPWSYFIRVFTAFSCIHRVKSCLQERCW